MSSEPGNCFSTCPTSVPKVSQSGSSIAVTGPHGMERHSMPPAISRPCESGRKVRTENRPNGRLTRGCASTTCGAPMVIGFLPLLVGYTSAQDVLVVAGLQPLDQSDAVQ